MSYEQLRSSLQSRLIDRQIPPKLLNDMLTELDIVSAEYDIKRACTDIIAYNEGIQPLVKMYIASLAVRNCAKSTLKDYTMILDKMFDAVRKPYNMFTANDIRIYLSGINQNVNWSPETREHKRSVICTFFAWLVDNEYLSRNPAKNIPVTKLPKKKLKPLKQIELERFRSVCQTPRERALVDLLFSSGVRISEAVNLMIEDIDFRDRTIFIRNGKGGKDRITNFNPESEISLRKYLETRKGNDQHVFCKTRSPYTGVTRESLEKEIRKIRDRVPDIGVKATPHTFRRTMATTASDRGMPIEEIQTLLGHSNISTTMRYITIDESRVKTDYNRFMAG